MSETIETIKKQLAIEEDEICRIILSIALEDEIEIFLKKN